MIQNSDYICVTTTYLSLSCVTTIPMLLVLWSNAVSGVFFWCNPHPTRVLDVFTRLFFKVIFSVDQILCDFIDVMVVLHAGIKKATEAQSCC